MPPVNSPFEKLRKEPEKSLTHLPSLAEREDVLRKDCSKEISNYKNQLSQTRAGLDV